MILIPNDRVDREVAIDLFLDAMEQSQLTMRDASDMLGQLRLMGDVVNLERLSRRLAGRDGACRPAPDQ